jgi:hypothetical protein
MGTSKGKTMKLRDRPVALHLAMKKECKRHTVTFFLKPINVSVENKASIFRIED